MEQLTKTKSNFINYKTKYKLNVYKKGTVYADSILSLVYKLITKKFVKNENTNMGKGRKPIKAKSVDKPLQKLNS